jgi:hypothetical protein
MIMESVVNGGDIIENTEIDLSEKMSPTQPKTLLAEMHVFVNMKRNEKSYGNHHEANVNEQHPAKMTVMRAFPFNKGRYLLGRRTHDPDVSSLSSQWRRKRS